MIRSLRTVGEDAGVFCRLYVLLGAGLWVQARAGCPAGCKCPLESRTVLCVAAGLLEVPRELPLETVSLHLEHNLIHTIPEDAFQDLLHLQDLYLSHNKIDSLATRALRHLSTELRLLDLSNNQLRHARWEEFGVTRAKVRLYHNPWHCDCNLQQLMEGLYLEPETVNQIVCKSSVRGINEGSRWDDSAAAASHIGQPLVKLLDSGVNFCSLQRRTTDVAMLITMFLWFFMVIVYVVYYVRQNRPQDTNYHLNQQVVNRNKSVESRNEESARQIY
ncbi:leucine-rich repeat-containing protein 3 [Astyanax mexicanus]|uniref:leucine-rich repeat-containing protein 3 n=1 Tax=Astyanax mexicanus TaxID=7994 RepID=UPI000440BC9A|nr:leucine-rich repeat-containing protein 3 [Astyanax mexicanus]